MDMSPTVNVESTDVECVSECRESWLGLTSLFGWYRRHLTLLTFGFTTFGNFSLLNDWYPYKVMTAKVRAKVVREN